MTGLTTHVLDIGVGKPAAAIPIKLLNKNGQIIKETITNADGRTDSPILSGIAFEAGKYSLIFNVKKYLKDNFIQHQIQQFQMIKKLLETGYIKHQRFVLLEMKI